MRSAVTRNPPTRSSKYGCSVTDERGIAQLPARQGPLVGPRSLETVTRDRRFANSFSQVSAVIQVIFMLAANPQRLARTPDTAPPRR